jgi:hypothetical protein
MRVLIFSLAFLVDWLVRSDVQQVLEMVVGWQTRSCDVQADTGGFNHVIC